MSLTRIQFIKPNDSLRSIKAAVPAPHFNVTWATGWIWKIVHIAYTLHTYKKHTRILVNGHNWVNGLSLLLLVFVRSFVSFFPQIQNSDGVVVVSCSSMNSFARKREKDMNKTTWNTVNWIRWAQNECYARKILYLHHSTIQPLACPFARPFVRALVHSFARSLVRLSIHRNDICCAAGAAAAATSANASTNTCAHRVLVCNALDNTLTQIRMYAFVLPMENESGE